MPEPTEQPIKRWKSDDELTAAEHVERLRDPHRKFETIEYSSAVQRALTEVGLWDEDELPPPQDPNQRTTEQHLNALQRRN